jgi:hypothetical protein
VYLNDYFGGKPYAVSLVFVLLAVCFAFLYRSEQLVIVNNQNSVSMHVRLYDRTEILSDFVVAPMSRFVYKSRSCGDGGLSLLSWVLPANREIRSEQYYVCNDWNTRIEFTLKGEAVALESYSVK